MNKRFVAGLALALSSVFAAPAFAGGYGPAPHYRPDVGAPASQHGVSAQTFAAEEAAQRGTDSINFNHTARTAQNQSGQISASASSQVAQ